MKSIKKTKRSNDVLGYNCQDKSCNQTDKQLSNSKSEPESKSYHEISKSLISRSYFALECDDQNEE